MVQNNISRAVNVMIVNDGALSDLQTYALYGFQTSVLTGVIPETILIGVPQANGSSTRQYELTYDQCDSTVWGKYGNQDPYTGTPPVPTAYYGCPGSPGVWEAGGNDAFLMWVNSTVIPAVLEKLGFYRHETAIMGGSYGGLSALYAASKYPTIFSRAYSFAGSVQWNFAEIASVITNNYQSSGERPTAVVMELGHEAYDVFQYYPSGENQNLLQLSHAVYEAWLGIGMEVIPWSTLEFPPTSQNSYLTAIPGYAPNNTITFYAQRGAIHLVPNWELGLTEGLPFLYRSNFPSVNSSRLQRSNNLQFVSLPTSTADDDDSSDSSHSNNTVAVIVLAGLLSIAVVALAIVSYLIVLEKKRSSTSPLASKEQSSSQMNQVELSIHK
jgi:pimeloyl-ACP methyl ester carboxylesterase